jgi:thiamine pyrophosphate-dependent acetolactate synthase large subunit-like protein
MNNSTLSIIRDGCSHIIGDKPQQYNHARIESIDWQQIARGFGWRYFKIKPDLTNLSLAMQAAYDHQPGAILIDLPVDDQQVLGHNFRYTQLKNHGNL